MDPIQLIAISSAVSAITTGGLVYLATRPSKSDMIIHNVTQEELGLEGCGPEVTHIFTLKKDKRMSQAKTEHSRSVEKKNEIDAKILDVQAEIRSLNKRLDKVLAMIREQGTIGQRDVVSQNEFTFPAMKIANELNTLSALLNQYTFEASRTRFFDQVKNGDERGRVLKNLIDKSDGTRIHETKISEFIKAQIKMMETKVSTAELLDERFVTPISES
jgi:hypothetical protein